MTAAQRVAKARFSLEGGKEASMSSSQLEEVPSRYGPYIAGLWIARTCTSKSKRMYLTFARWMVHAQNACITLLTGFLVGSPRTPAKDLWILAVHDGGYQAVLRAEVVDKESCARPDRSSQRAQREAGHPVLEHVVQ